MSDWNACFDFMMNNEDPARACAAESDECPAGCVGPCFAIAGINSGVFPQQFAEIVALPRGERETAIEAFYQKNFWNQWFAQLVSDQVAMRVFDAAVNMGPGTAVGLLQQAVNSFHQGNPLAVDSGWGPLTLAATNACNPLTLVPAFRHARVAHLEEHDAGNPALAALIARAQK
jgi:hypothetical protein